MMDNKGTGIIHPEDTEEYMEITVTVEDETVTDASYKVFEDETAIDCAKTACRVIKGHTLEDIMQTTNNAVFYNTEKKIPRTKLYLGAMATMAAKRAVHDYAVKHGIKLSGGCCCMD